MLKALAITPQSYPVYQRAMVLLGGQTLALQTINGHFVVLRDGRRRVEYYDEKDFRQDFEWVSPPMKEGKPDYRFREIKELRNTRDE